MGGGGGGEGKERERWGAMEIKGGGEGKFAIQKLSSI